MCIKNILFRGFTNVLQDEKVACSKSSGQFMPSDESAIESDAAHSHTDSSDTEKDSKVTVYVES